MKAIKKQVEIVDLADLGLSDVMCTGIHPYSYRSGEAGEIIGVVWMNKRACFRIRFDDGAEDTVPIYGGNIELEEKR